MNKLYTDLPEPVQKAATLCGLDALEFKHNPTPVLPQNAQYYSFYNEFAPDPTNTHYRQSIWVYLHFDKSVGKVRKPVHLSLAGKRSDRASVFSRVDLWQQMVAWGYVPANKLLRVHKIDKLLI